MTMLPPSGFDELATKTDLRLLSVEIRQEILSAVNDQATRYLSWMMGGYVLVVAAVSLVVSIGT